MREAEIMLQRAVSAKYVACYCGIHVVVNKCVLIQC